MYISSNHRKRAGLDLKRSEYIFNKLIKLMMMISQQDLVLILFLLGVFPRLKLIITLYLMFVYIYQNKS